MKLQVAVHDIEFTAELAGYVRRRVHFGLGRFGGRIRSVSMRLSDANGPRGGIDQCCEVRVDAGLRQPVIVRERQAGMHAAVAFAVERAERALRRQLELGGPGHGGASRAVREAG